MRTRVQPIAVARSSPALMVTPTSHQRNTGVIDQRPLRQAVLVLVEVLVNVGLSLTYSAIALFSCVAGNVFSGQSARDQSYASFVASNMVLSPFYCSSAVFLSQVSLLLGQTFESAPEQPAGFLFCSRRVSRAVWRYPLLLIVGIVIFVFVFDAETQGQWRSCHIDFYVLCVMAPVTVANMVFQVRQIFHQETVQGNDAGAGSFVFVQFSPTSLHLALAGIYVQAVTRLELSTDKAIVWFGFGSFTLKIVVQEIVKLVILKRRVNDIRTIFLSVGLPTVLIDTQIRLAMQRYQSASMSLLSSVLMAVVEITLRWVKVLKLFLEMQYYERRLVRQLGGQTHSIARNAISPTANDVEDKSIQITVEVQKWRQRLHLFHAAEVFADMSAEYIAIGCSALFLYAFRHHPKYELALLTKHGSTTANLFGVQVTSSAIVWIQLALEVVIDLVSTTLEISQGVEFQELRKHRAYIAMSFLGIGLLNVQVSSLMYLKGDASAEC